MHMTRKQYENQIRLIAVSETSRAFRKSAIIKAIVAPIVLPNDTKIKPYQNPNNAPPIKVRPRANGNDKEVVII